MREGTRNGTDHFFTTQTCDRCGNPDMGVRMLSWFNEQTLCRNCMAGERALRSELRERGVDDGQYEGCGYIPPLPPKP